MSQNVDNTRNPRSILIFGAAGRIGRPLAEFPHGEAPSRPGQRTYRLFENRCGTEKAVAPR
jgi:hypothetical protein